jgi:ParB/RepB/Spo0J family partition protein
MSIQHVSIPVLKDSPLHRRRSWGNIDELAASITAEGQIEPGVARVLEDGEVELLIGYRRRLALTSIGRTSMVVDVLANIDDDKALSIILIENLQREDAHPLDEAELYQQLYERGASVQEIAERIGRPKRYVYGRLQLVKLAPEAKALFESGGWSLGCALLVARLSEGQQKDAAKMLAPRKGSEPISAAEAESTVRTRIALPLANVPWSLGADGVGGKVACDRCPRNTATQRGLFETEIVDSKDAYCMDRGCFDEKREADWKARVKAAEGSGQKVLSKEEAKKLFPTEYAQPQGYAPNTFYDGKKSRPIAEAVKAAKLDVKPVLVQHPKTRETLELYPKAVVAKLEKALGTAPKGPKLSDSEKAAQAKRDAAEARDRRLVAACVAVLEKRSTPSHGDLVALIQMFGISPDMADRRGWPQNGPLDWRGFSHQQLFAVLWETQFIYGGEELAKEAARLGVNVEKLDEPAKAAEKKPEPAKAPAKGKARSPLTDAKEAARLGVNLEKLDEPAKPAPKKAPAKKGAKAK